MTSVRPTRREDLPALAALYAEGFARALDAAEWEWKFARLPGEARSLVAGDGDEVVAHVGALALPVRWRGEERLGWQLVDFVGRPRGLRPPLVTAGRALLADLPRGSDLPWIFGFPSGRHLALGERVFGYRWLPPVTVWEGTLPIAGGLDTAAIVAHGDTAEASAYDVWRACGVDGVVRNAAFLNWRYHARPARYYRFYRLRREGVDGLVIVAFAGELAQLAEVWLPAGPDWLPALRAVAADLVAAGIGRWRSWPLPPPHGEAPLAALGLRPLDERVPCGCCGPRGGGAEIVALASSLYYAMGDHDLV